MPTIRKERVSSGGAAGPSGDRASITSRNWKQIKAAQRAEAAAGSSSSTTPATAKDSGAAFGADMSAEESAATYAPPPPPPPPPPQPAAAPPRIAPPPPPVQRQHGAACDAPGCAGTRPAAAAIPLCRACTLEFTRALNADASYRQVRDRVLAAWLAERQLADAFVAEAEEQEEAVLDA